MKILHVSAECYPAAKVGGLADVVGSLPKYLNQGGDLASVIIPGYSLPWLNKQEFEDIYSGHFRIQGMSVPFVIKKVINDELGYPLYVSAIPGLFDRDGVYADSSGRPFRDEVERYISFQLSVLEWLINSDDKPDVLHCHDHHTGLIPFFVKHGVEFRSLSHIPTVFTIHNGAYHGTFGWNKLQLLPYFDQSVAGLLDWNKAINPLASGIKCCSKLTTVSPGYLEELNNNSNGLEWLFDNESAKSVGILNGIDTQVWNPSTDEFIIQNLKKKVSYYKKKNKKAICDAFGIDPALPIVTFIGRLVREKGADIIPNLLGQFLQSGPDLAFVVLGTGDAALMDVLFKMGEYFKGRFHAALEYNEGMAHQLYAGSDFLFMPSRVEPCGLNQLYSLRYGTVPIVRSVGGLKDTIIDIGEKNGRGIRFDNFSVDDAGTALWRATELYKDKKSFQSLQERIMELDFSWERSAKEYRNIYSDLIQ